MTEGTRAQQEIGMSVARFFNRPDIAVVLDRIATLCGDIQDVVVVGGVIRELVLDELLDVRPFLADLDIVLLRKVARGRLIEGLGKQRCKENTFGGLKYVTAEGLEVDIWSAASQAALLGKRIGSRATVAELLTMIDFNVNAGVYIPATGVAITAAIEGAVASRKIEFNNSLVGARSIQLARILLLEWRLREAAFRLGRGVVGWCVETLRGLNRAQRVTAMEYFVRKSRARGLSLPAAYFDRRLVQFMDQHFGDTHLGRVRA